MELLNVSVSVVSKDQLANKVEYKALPLNLSVGAVAQRLAHWTPDRVIVWSLGYCRGHRFAFFSVTVPFSTKVYKCMASGECNTVLYNTAV